jgi:hypothetical protein
LIINGWYYTFYFTNYFLFSGRVISIDGYFIPPLRSKPFLIAFYHGDGKPCLCAFLSDLIKELNHLHPDTVLDEDQERMITVVIRAIIGDGPGRQWIRGCKGHSGYYACERCKIRGCLLRLQKTKTVTDEGSDMYGEIITETVTQRGVKFTSVKGEPRKDEDWHKYFQLERGETLPNMKHRVAETPIDKIIGLKPISSFPVEEMHLVDGGAIKSSLEVLLKITDPSKIPTKRRRKVVSSKKKKISTAAGAAKKKIGAIPPKDLAGWNCRMAVWSKYCTPKEFGRHLRTLKCFKIYKMCETRQLMLYYMIPAMIMDKLFPRREMNIVVKLIKGYQLVTGNSYKPVPDSDLKTAAKCFREFFKGMRKLSKRVCTYRMHGAWKHLVDDAKYFGCRTTSLSAYPFENQVRFFRQVCIFEDNFINLD